MNALTAGIITLVAVLLLHLLEEILTGFRTSLPFGEMPLGLFVTINVLIYTYCAIMIYLSFNNDPVAVWMAWLFSIGMVINGVGHIGMMICKKGYFPGGVTAVLLLGTGINLLLILSRSG